MVALTGFMVNPEGVLGRRTVYPVSDIPEYIPQNKNGNTYHRLPTLVQGCCRSGGAPFGFSLDQRPAPGRQFGLLLIYENRNAECEQYSPNLFWCDISLDPILQTVLHIEQHCIKPR